MIYIGCDHAGFAMKQKIISRLKKDGIEFVDCGCYSDERTDYPIYAKKVCESIKNDSDKGLLICGSGIGMSICANRYKHIRACLAINCNMAYLGRHHNNANVLVLQGRNKTIDLNYKIMTTFLNEQFDGGRHTQRVEMLSK